jgi:hypothetical protein
MYITVSECLKFFFELENANSPEFCSHKAVSYKLSAIFYPFVFYKIYVASVFSANYNFPLLADLVVACCTWLAFHNFNQILSIYRHSQNEK